MKLVKYFSMVLIVFVMISNGSCETFKPGIINITSDKVLIDVSNDLTLCESGKMEMILPSERFSAGGIYYRNARGSLDFISNPNTSSYNPANITLPVIRNNSSKGLEARAAIDFFRSYTQATVGASFDSEQKINLGLALVGARIYTLTEDQIGEVIISAQNRLLNSQEVYIYKSVIYASGITYEFEKTNSSNRFVGLDISTGIIDTSLNGAIYKKENPSNSIVGTFPTPQAVLFCKTPISQERIRTEIAKKPSVKYRVNLQNINNMSAEESDGSGVLSPYTALVYAFTVKLENKPTGCNIRFRSRNKAHRENDTQSDGATSGKYGEDLIGINAYLQNCPSNWRINYRLNVNNGDSCIVNGRNICDRWQPWVCNKDEADSSRWAEIPNDDWRNHHIVGLKFKITTNGQCLQGNQ